MNKNNNTNYTYMHFEVIPFHTKCSKAHYSVIVVVVVVVVVLVVIVIIWIKITILMILICIFKWFPPTQNVQRRITV